MLLCAYIFILSFSGIYATIHKTNITDFSKCKVHYSRSEGTYRSFFKIADESRENDSLLDLHFSVLAPSDAHILLSPSSHLHRSDPVYEIVLGAGGNTFSDIRRQQKSAVKASIRVKGLLSSLDVHSFWLHVSKDGLIEVGREGEELAFISWQDPDPLPLNVFSFCTWPGVEAKWFYDCPREENVTINSEMVEKNLTSLERLRKDLLYYYDPYARPVYNVDNKTIVKMNFIASYITLDEHKSSLEGTGRAKLTWNDEKLKWNPEDYEEIRSLHIFHREIWRPDLLLINAVENGADILKESMLTVTNNGLVEWTPTIHFNAWCDASNLGHWPDDAHICDLFFGFPAGMNNLLLQFNVSGSKYAGNHDNAEWKVLTVFAISNYDWENSSVAYEMDNYPSFLQLRFTMERYSNVHTALYFTPFLVIATSMLGTFWVSPFGPLKISLGCLQIILASIMLTTLGVVIPSHPTNAPYLVMLYSWSLYASAICLVISAITINYSRKKYKNPTHHLVSAVLTSKPLKAVLFLPEIKVSKIFGKLDEISLTETDENPQDTWILLGTAIDRIAFIIYSILIIIAISMKY